MPEEQGRVADLSRGALGPLIRWPDTPLGTFPEDHRNHKAGTEGSGGAWQGGSQAQKHTGHFAEPQAEGNFDRGSNVVGNVSRMF